MVVKLSKVEQKPEMETVYSKTESSFTFTTARRVVSNCLHDSSVTSMQTIVNCGNQVATEAITKTFLVENCLWDTFHLATATITSTQSMLGGEIHVSLATWGCHGVFSLSKITFLGFWPLKTQVGVTGSITKRHVSAYRADRDSVQFSFLHTAPNHSSHLEALR